MTSSVRTSMRALFVAALLFLLIGTAIRRTSLHADSPAETLTSEAATPKLQPEQDPLYQAILRELRGDRALLATPSPEMEARPSENAQLSAKDWEAIAKLAMVAAEISQEVELRAKTGDQNGVSKRRQVIKQLQQAISTMLAIP